MVKHRMGTADIAAEVASLRHRGLVGMRLTNVYDIAPKVYVLKFARSGDDGDKVLLLIESGARLHTIEGMPEKNDVPSNFTLKLRKHVRTRRLESIKQLGVDRIVQLTFGAGDNTHHLILEFFAQGNVILTDASYQVLTLLRSHRDDAKGVATMARHVYPIHAVRLRQSLTRDALDATLDHAANLEEKAASTLKTAVGEALPYGPHIAEHCIRSAGLDPNRRLSDVPLHQHEHTALLAAIRSFEKWMDECCEEVNDDGEQRASPGGAILLSGLKTEEYIDFEPLLEENRPYAQHADSPKLTFPTFDAAVADYYGRMATQRAAQQQAQREKAATGKLEAIRRDHEARLEGLGREVAAQDKKAGLIEAQLQTVDAALNAVRDALATGMDWHDLARMIKAEKKAGNPIAGLIDSLQLEKNQVTLLLHDSLENDAYSVAEKEEEEDVDSRKKSEHRRNTTNVCLTKVEVDLNLSAAANARAHYDLRRKHADKARRTMEANERALAAAEKKAKEQIAKVRAQAAPGPSTSGIRKPYWFERFHWFISSENYLVLSGRDAQQNELLVKRYLQRGDAYVHADLHGASSTIVKNIDPALPIPPLTLSQAGQACVCRSAAWDAKVVTSAWWVHPDQVSKTAPTGEYLTTGSFMIRGRKNYLPPQPLVMGLAWMFKLEEGSVARHLGERPRRALVDHDQVLHDSGGDEKEQHDGVDVKNEEEDTTKSKSALEAFMDSSISTLDFGLPHRTATAGVTATFDRYGLPFSAEKEVTEHGDDDKDKIRGPSAGQEPQRRHLSAKERRLLKKGGAAEGSSKEEDRMISFGKKGGGSKNIEEDRVGPGPSTPPALGVDPLPPSRTMKRGKKAKGLSRYEDQDEEEKALAMALLQSSGQKKDRKQRKEERKSKLAARKAEASGVALQAPTEDDIARLTARLTANDDDSDGNAEEGDDESKEEARLPDVQERPFSNEVVGSKEEGLPQSEREEIAALLADEGVELLEEADKERLTQLDELTGLPRGEDDVLAAIVVCAPYQVVAGYKYKVKLVPGGLKKGKAYRQAIELVAGKASGAAAEDRAGQRERDLVRGVPEVEGIAAMLGGVKLQMAGLQKMQQAKKKGAKKNKK